MRKSIWAYLLSAVMLMSMVVYPIGVGAALPEPVDGYIVQDDFSGGMDQGLEQVGDGGGSLEIQDGKLALTRVATDSGFDGLRYHFKEDKSGITQGVVGMEITVEKEVENEEVWFKWQNPAAKDTVAVCWTSDGLVSSYQGGTNKNVLSDVSGTGPRTFQVLLNLDQNTYSLWMDGKKLVTNWKVRVVPDGGVSQFYAYLQKANAYTAYFDDLTVFESVIPDEEKTLYDKTWLTQDKLTSEPAEKITQKLELPTQGEYGSTITWTSSVPEVIAKDGTVSPAAEDTKVTLTADITAGAKAQQQTFTFQVPGKGSEVVTTPTPAGGYIVRDDFSGEMTKQLEKVGAADGSLEIQDGKLALTRKSTATSGDNSFDGLRYHFKEDKSGITQGVVGMEITVEKEVENEEVWFKWQNPAAKDTVAVCWTSDGLVSSYQGGTNKNVLSDVSGTGPRTFQVLLNLDQNTYSLWMDGKKLVTNWKVRVVPDGGVSQFYAYLQKANAYTAYFDDLTVFESVIPDEEKTLYDKTWLTQDKLTSEPAEEITQKLTLPAAGEYGSTITWTSSKPEVIAKDGTVSPAAEDTEVTLTADITAGAKAQQQTFTLVVRGSGSTTISKPSPVDGYIVNDSFAGEMDPRIEKVLSATGSLEVQDGKLALTRTETDTGSKTADAYRYFFLEKDSEGTVSGIADQVIGVEFTLEKTKGNTEVWAKIQDVENRDLVAIWWNNDGKLYLYDGGSGKVIRDDLTGTGPVSFQLLVNPKQGVFSAWMDGAKVAENFSFRYSMREGGIAQLYTYLQKGNAYTLYTDDIKVYQSVIPSKEQTLYDAVWLTQDKLTGEPAEEITQNLTLPTQGEYGSTITWTSDKDYIIGTDGTVNKPAGPDTAVTLTAAITADGCTEQKTFDFIVKGSVAILDQPMPENELIVDDGFESSTLDARIEPVLSETGSLAAQDGKLALTRTETSASSKTADAFRYYFLEKGTGIADDVIAIEFTLEKSKGNTEVWAKVQDVENRDLVAICWNTDGKLHLYDGKSGKAVREGLTGTRPLTFQILVNPMQGVFSAWVDGERVAENWKFRYSMREGGVAQLYTYLQKGNAYTLYVDNMKMYRSLIPCKEQTLYDKTWLTQDKLTGEPADAVTQNLKLPTQGEFGSTITWSSSVPSVISSSGQITQPAENTAVTMTAEIASGPYQQTSTFDFVVAAGDVLHMPVPKDGYIVQDSFDGAEMDARIEKYGDSNGILKQENGRISVTRTSTVYETSDGFRYHFMDSHGGTGKEVVALEFTIEKSEANREVLFRVRGERDTDYVAATWTANGDVTSFIGGTNKTVKRGLSGKGPHKVTILINTVYNTYSMWIDQERVVENGETRTSDVSGPTQLLTWIQRNNTFTYYIDDFAVYEPEIPDVEKLRYDETWLTGDKITFQPLSAVTMDLNLPQTGQYGSEIVWSSSAPDIVASDGTVTRPADGSRSVTLTATLKSGTGTVEKQFTINVLKQSPAGDVPKADGEEVFTHIGQQNSVQSYYFSANKSPFRGEYALEFTLTQPDLVSSTVAALKSGDASALELKFENGAVQLLSRASRTAQAAWHTYQTGLDFTKPVQVHILVSTRANKCSVWLDGKKIADAVFTSQQISSVDHMTVQSLSAVTTQDIAFYKAILPDMDKILFDDEYLTWEHLTWQDASYVFENVPLPQTGMFGSAVVWESSAPGTIAVDGTVTRPASGSQQVRLTATMTAGAETTVKTFDVTVVAMEEVEMPEVGELIMQEDCSSLEPSPAWELEQNGGTVEQRFGAMEITRYENTSGATIATRYFDEDKTEYQGVLGLEFTIRKSEPEDFHLRVASGYDYFALNWVASGVINVNYNVSEDSAEAWYNVGSVQGLSAKFNLLFNTEDNTYSLWVNNKMLLHNVYARGRKATGIQRIRTWLEKNHFCTLSIDNIKLYHSYLLEEDRIAADEEWLTLDKILTKEPDALTPDTVDSNLNLMNKGYYGSDITWTSSDPSLVEPDGTVHQPDASYTEDPQVTLTATISAGGMQVQKQITLHVKRNLTQAADQVQADLNLLTLSRISPENSDQITMSLNLVGKGAYGSDITWTSSDTAAITQSGRVIRPWTGQGNRTVQVTATVSKDGISQEKQFTFTVLADEAFTDPQHMTDAEFFGVWDSAAGTWTQQGKLDYAFNSQMASVGEAVKMGDLALAKQRLLEYMRDKENKYSVGLDKRDTNWANMSIDDFYHLRGSEFYQGEFVANNDWQQLSATLKPADVPVGAMATYAVTAWYNEASELQIYSQNAQDRSLRPRLEVNVNGKMQTFEAVDDVTIRAGSYRTTNYGGEETLKVKTYGEFLSSETYKAMIKFDLSSIGASDKISDVRLVVTAKADPAFSGSKRIMVQQEPATLWSEDTAVWNTFLGYIYSYNGLPGKNTWLSPKGADIEYLYQMNRFSALVPIALEYNLTGDETYPYKALQIMADFINDVGGWETNERPAKRGGYTRSLDSAIRLQSWERSYDLLVDSPYMTTELNTAILKAMYDMVDCLRYHHADSGNWMQTEHMAMLQTALLFPEFIDAKTGEESWMQTAINMLEPLIYESILPDGSYVEATGSYNTGAYGSFRGFKTTMRENGVEVSDAYNDRLHKGAYYNALLFAPDGKSIQYGDETYSQWTPRYTDVAQWFNDNQLLYIDTLGAQGTQPDWTSMQFLDSKITLMRSDWGQQALYLFTNVRGGGQHGHEDNNHVTVAAYGRILLNDGGIFTYTATDPYRIWGKSSTGHNTVVINGKNQVSGSETGNIEQWNVSDKYNYLSQTTTSTTGFTHNRKITFIKPSFWIVSDKITPDAAYTENEYKQNWHMLPEANMTVDAEHNVIRSNYPSGANIIVANADKNALAKEEQGWYDKSYGEVVEAKYGYFQKEKAVGTVTFDTVLVPTQDDPNAQVAVEKLPAAADATALEIHMDLRSGDKTGWYYQTDSAAPAAAQFGAFETDAEMAYVELDSKGEVKLAILQNGTYIRDTAAGKDLVRLEQKGTITLEKVGTKMAIGTEQSVGGVLDAVEREPLPKASILQIGNVKQMEVNGEKITFGEDNGYLVPYGTGGGSENSGDTSQGGIVPPGGGTGGGSGGGGGTGGGGVTPTTPAPSGNVTPTPTPSASSFADVQQHWAKKEVEALAQQGVVQGDNGLFRPDDNITRAEFLAMVQRASGEQEQPYQGLFQDVKASDWFAGAVQYGLDSGLIAPAEQFRPNDNITREEMAKIVVEACRKAGLEAPADYRAAYPDVDRSSWSAPYIDAADYLGIIRGMENGLFAPQENASRGQGAVMIWRYLEKKGE